MFICHAELVSASMPKKILRLAKKYKPVTIIVMENIQFLIFFICIIAAYIVGSIPSGYILGRLIKGIDIRQYGSGNIGASNVARILGMHYFLIVFFIDCCKAWATLALCAYMLPFHTPMILYALAGALLVGNAYSVFLCFAGGKGVATVVGIIAFFYPWWIAVLFASGWLLLVFLTRKPFIASLFVSVATTTIIVLSPLMLHKPLSFILTTWIVWRHIPNIQKWLFKR